MKLKEVIKEMGLDYMEMVRNSESISETANEGGYRQCGVCGDWQDQCDYVVTSGMFGGDDICDDCMNNKPKNKDVIEAKEELIKLGEPWGE